MQTHQLALCLLVLGVVLVGGTDFTPCQEWSNGCSIPMGLPFPYKEMFRPACFRHDLCYGCVSTSNASVINYITFTNLEHPNAYIQTLL